MTDDIPLVSWEGNNDHGLGNGARSQMDETHSPPAVCPESGPERSQLKFKNLTAYWVRECIAVIFSVLCMVAIAVIALKIDGIRLSQ